jgi:hypothetical protein
VAAIEIRFEITGHFLGTRAQRDGFVLLIAFLCAFLFIRTSARLMRSPKVPWWPGSVETSGGLHLHHLVWGICLLLLSGFLGFALDPRSPWSEVLAALFGIGAGLTLDEFALWVRLEDVYWSQEGRESVDAVIVATLIGGLILVGLAPFESNDAAPGIDLFVVILIDVILCALAAIKGRLLLALIGVFLPPFSLWGAVRLAAPKSPWARWRYKPGSRKIDRSYERFRRAHARHRRVIDLIGGRPEMTDASAAVALAQPEKEDSR